MLHRALYCYVQLSQTELLSLAKCIINLVNLLRVFFELFLQIHFYDLNKQFKETQIESTRLEKKRTRKGYGKATNILKKIRSKKTSGKTTFGRT